MPFHSWTRRTEGGRETELRCSFSIFYGAVWRDWRGPFKPLRKDWDQKHLCTLWWKTMNNLCKKNILYVEHKQVMRCSKKKKKKSAKCESVRVLGLYLLNDWNILCSVWLRAFSSKHSLYPASVSGPLNLFFFFFFQCDLIWDDYSTQGKESYILYVL